MNSVEEVKNISKEFIYKQYLRIVHNSKEYDNITKVEMLEEIYALYSNYQNIIDICTERELIYLRKCLNKDNDINESKYAWEKTALYQKFLISYACEIPERIQNNIELALTSVNIRDVRYKDKINEFLVPHIKIHGICSINILVSLCSKVLNISENKILKHISNNLVFNFYCLTINNHESETVFIAFYDYLDILEELTYQKERQSKARAVPIELGEYKTLFYNPFNLNNEKIKKFYDNLCNLPFFRTLAIEKIQQTALLNSNRDDLKKFFQSSLVLKNYDLTEFLSLLEDALDEMPSGALNGLTPSQVKEIDKKEAYRYFQKQKNHVMQTNAALSPKDAKLFTKLFTALLDYTNQKLKIEPKLKIYNKRNILPEIKSNIAHGLWLNKENIIDEFCLSNPYGFNEEELSLIREFKKGIRDIFVIIEYEEEYTALLANNKIYMIKGIDENIDSIISYMDLPFLVFTTVIPFKNYLIYDSTMVGLEINLGFPLEDVVLNLSKDAMKYYHL